MILLDEPTAYLDLPRRVELMRLLRRIAHTEQKAVIVSSHDLDLAFRTADCIWLLSSDGSLAVVYSDGIWYHHVDAALLARIVHEHLERGEPVEEAIFHRLGAGAGEEAP